MPRKSGTALSPFFRSITFQIEKSNLLRLGRELDSEIGVVLKVLHPEHIRICAPLAIARLLPPYWPVQGYV